MRILRTCGYYVRNPTNWRRPKTIGILFTTVAIIHYILYSILYMLVINMAEFRKCMNGGNSYEHLYTQKEGGINEITMNCIQLAPDFATQTTWAIPLAANLSKPYLRLPKQMVYTQRVAILSPVRDAAARLELFANLLSTLSYPHSLISVHFGEDGSQDDTIEVAKRVSHQLVHKSGFANATVYKLKIKGNKTNRRNRHYSKYQLERRSHMGKARNLIMEYGIQNEEWILWIDCDVISFRADLVQQFLYSNKDVMVASGMRTITIPLLFSSFNIVYSYDSNTFREVLYDDTQYRIYLFDLKSEGREVPVDYVGGCALMIRADCYRKGLRFTEKPYKPVTFKLGTKGVDTQLNIETEGLAKMARDLGMSVYGLPHLEVFHE